MTGIRESSLASCHAASEEGCTHCLQDLMEASASRGANIILTWVKVAGKCVDTLCHL